MNFTSSYELTAVRARQAELHKQAAQARMARQVLKARKAR